MAVEQLATEDPTSGKSYTANYDFGDGLQDAVNRFGEEVVFTNFRKAARISLQALVRTSLKAGLAEDKIAEKVASWKPGVSTRGPGKSKIEKVTDLFSSLSPEAKAEFIAKLRAEMAGASS